MSVVSFISDMGYDSINLSIAKAKFYARFNLIPLMDIAHDVEYSDINEAAFILRNCLPDFPAKSVHLIVMRGDTNRNSKLLVTKVQGQFIIGLDNGASSLIDSEAEYFEIKQADRDEKKLAVLLMDTAIKLIDAHYEVEQIAEPTNEVHINQWPVPVMSTNSLSGVVLYTDFHGNAFTNIRLKDITELTQGRGFRVNLSIHEWVDKIEPSTEFVPKGEISIISDASGFLIVTIHGGNAQKLLGLRKGRIIKVEVQEKANL
jgi:S-adenosyl-L-methionine hydrolase (adenosine-forming)